MKHALPFIAVSAAAAAVLTLSACGTTGSNDVSRGMNDGGSTKATQTAAPNNAEVAFVTNMIPHHTQAASMADMATTQAASAQVKQLATKIKADQQPQLKTMHGQMTGWGIPVQAMGEGHDMGTMGAGMNGMMTSTQMGALGKARGAQFDRMWLQMMIKHHQGAVSMSRTELSQASNPDNKKLAQSIIDAQTVEITQMTSMMANVGG